MEVNAEKRPQTAAIVQHGLDKLGEYEEYNQASNAYTLATSMWQYYAEGTCPNFTLVINPRYKHKWFKDHLPKQANAAETLFLAEVRNFIILKILSIVSLADA